MFDDLLTKLKTLPDLPGVKIIHAAGAKSSAGITRGELEQIISETGYLPVERDSFYNRK